ncbi:MAG TPA: hypothetical protein PK834_04815, partial [Thauera aminoaromatica]|nr:hypothetical protein [Thauera aminoaromatica]
MPKDLFLLPAGTWRTDPGGTWAHARGNRRPSPTPHPEIGRKPPGNKASPLSLGGDTDTRRLLRLALARRCDRARRPRLGDPGAALRCDAQPPPCMHHLSFRSILLASFLLITASLAAAVAGGWRGMETVVRAIQEDKQRALALSAAARQLRERSVNLERSARQYEVLGEPALARRFEATLAEALPALALLESAGPALASAGAAWRACADRIAAWLASLAIPRPTDGV